MKKTLLSVTATCAVFLACTNSNNTASGRNGHDTADIVKPLYTTQPVEFDTDDPAVWINKQDSSKSLVIGTDKDENGGLYVYDLKGNIIKDKVIKGLKRPNNVDVAYGLKIGGKSYDIAVLTERLTHKIRIYSLPDMKPLDNGGIEVYKGETNEMYRDLMGIALYTAPNGQIHAIVGRKTGPTTGNYLWQYLLEDDGTGKIKISVVRKFGSYSGKKEIESIAVDNELGYIYYSDEQHGVHKYYADPSKGNKELALFAKEGFREDHEGISIYKTSDSTGYILVSDQSANQFKVYSREGTKLDHNDHRLITSIKVSTNQSDGSDIVSMPLNKDFKHGIFIAMSDNRTFQYYKWEDIEKRILSAKAVN
jgi:3-phytase